MRLVATRDIHRGEDLVHAYHEPGMPNNHMFAHYGFVPFLSETEEVALFAGDDEALAWMREQVCRLQPDDLASSHRLGRKP